MDPLTQLLGESPGIVAVRQQVARLLARQAESRRTPPILIQGETGTGKGLLARAMHGASPRGSGPFIDVNCAAIPETLLEAEMFGVERGAFTDARQAKPGLLQLAHRGTIFLDEIGLLPETLQAKLLKAIEEREVRRLGGTRSESVDVWVIAATNEDLAAAVSGRRFRADLYHRLAVVTLSLPPLRDRGEDVVLLAEHFLARACGDYGMPSKALSPAAREALVAFRWPGNIRELGNVMERVALLSDTTEVTPQMLGLVPAGAPPAPPPAAPAKAPRSLEAAVDDVERQHLLAALEATDWNVTRAAVRLGISRNTLRYRIEKHGLRPGAPPARRQLAPRPPAHTERAPTPQGAPAPAGPVFPAAAPRERRRLALLAAALTVPSGTDAPFVSRRALEVMTDKAGSFGGRVEELNRTAIVAVFGLEPVEDAPVRAANAALAIINGIERLRRASAAHVSVTAAVHVDHFVVASGNGGAMIDRDARFHAWSFLESLLASAEPDGIAVSAGAATLLERRFDLSPAALGEPGATYRLAGRERSGAASYGRAVTFVGRRQELDLLNSRLESAVRGLGQIVGIAGEAGIGKSRLLVEFRRPLASRTVTYLEGRCQSYGATIPYAPVLDVVRAACQVADTDSPEAIAAKVVAALCETGMDAADAAYVLHLLGVKEAGDAQVPVEPDTVKPRVFDTLRQYLVRSSRRRPLALVIEDLHWIDRTSEEFFASFADVVGGAPILLVATYRSGYRPPWIDRSYATQMALPPLDDGAGLAVVRSVLGPAAVDEGVIEMILVRGEGNPFFLEELARTVGELGGVETAVVVPATVHDVLLSRIDRLPPMEKHLLHVAAVIGKDAPLPLIREVAGLPEATLRQSLARLRAAELLYETSFDAEPHYTFKHALTHDVAYAAVGDRRRRELHDAVVTAIEHLHAERLGDHIERLADHAFRAERWDKAVVHLRAAGLKAAERSAHREAVPCFERALLALRRLPEDRTTLEQALDLRFDMRVALQPLGQFAPMLDHLRAAEQSAKALGDRRRLGLVLAYLTDYWRLMGDQDQALATGREALALADAVGDLTLLVRANTYLGQVYYARGDYGSAASFFTRNIATLSGALSRERLGSPQPPSVHVRTCLVWCLAELGDFREGAVQAQEGLRIAEFVEQPLSIATACSGLGHLHLRKGELSQAIVALERGLEACRTWNVRIWFPRVASALAAAYALAGRVGEAVPLVEQAVGQSSAMGLMGNHSLLVGWQAEVYLRAGRLSDAAEAGRQALELSRRHSEAGHHAWAEWLLAEIAMSGERPRPDDADGHLVRARDQARQLGMRPLLAACVLALGRVCRLRGDQSGAVGHLMAAAAAFRDLEMTRGLGETEAELGRLA